MKMKRQPSRFEIAVGDYVKFKTLKGEDKKFDIHYGKVTELHETTGHIGIKIKEENNSQFPPGLTIYIEKKQVLQVYNPKMIPNLSPKASLKHIWQDFIFREVKVTKCHTLLYAEYKYIGKNGFEKVKRFHSMEEAYEKVDPCFYKNIIPHYGDFFGFTTARTLKNNDLYYDKEIFFSKKCYTELDWSDRPTGDFLTNERGYNSQAPEPDSLICGIVENGEKGLFYRKWFLCSREFALLWSMVCDPTDASLYEQDSTWNSVEKRKVEKKKNVKTFEKLMKELDTSCYSVNLKMDLKERKEKYHVFNLERAAMFYNTRYKQVAQILFSKGFLENKEFSLTSDFRTAYTSFQKRLVSALLWPKDLFRKI